MITPAAALLDSFAFGLIHGILPDEHTWPITFSYAIGGASGRAGLRAGLLFSAAFTLQRSLVSELANLALARYLLIPLVNSLVYIVVGVVMSAAGWLVLQRNRNIHLHLLGHHHPGGPIEMEPEPAVFTHHHAPLAAPLEPAAPPARWALAHGFIAGFGFGGFAIYVNTVAAPAMPSPWLGFLPGLVYGLGTMVSLALVGALFGASLRWLTHLPEQAIQRIGARTGGRTLLFGGALFALFGLTSLAGILPPAGIDTGYFFIGLFMVLVAIPSLVVSWREVSRRTDESALVENNFPNHDAHNG